MSNNINYIDKVEVSGLWQRYDIVWHLNPDVNILAGINGSGKTTILDCICGLLSIGKMHDSYFGKVNEVKLFFDNKKCLPYQYIKVNDTIKNLEQKAKKSHIYKEIISDLKEQEGKNYSKIKSVEFERHSTSFEDLKMTLIELRQAINVDIVSTFDASLKPSEAVKKLSNDKVKTELDLELYQLQSKYLKYQLNIGRKKDTLVEESSENFKEEFEKTKYPKARFLEIIDDLFSETGKKINREKDEIEFLIDKLEINQFQLSSGEKQLLIILLTVLIQDNKPSILFMDEPEISLHIGWQRKIIRYIRELNPNVQIIIATHSPALVIEGWHDKVFEIRDIIVKDNKIL
ncbi:MAG: ATP-binding protein [Methylococcales bacterium]